MVTIASSLSFWSVSQLIFVHSSKLCGKKGRSIPAYSQLCKVIHSSIHPCMGICFAQAVNKEEWKSIARALKERSQKEKPKLTERDVLWLERQAQRGSQLSLFPPPPLTP